MSINNYVLIDSSFRDRTQFPNPANFEINFATDNQDNVIFDSAILFPYPNQPKTISTIVQYNQNIFYNINKNNNIDISILNYYNFYTNQVSLDNTVYETNNNQITVSLPLTQNTYNNAVIEFLSYDNLEYTNIPFSVSTRFRPSVYTPIISSSYVSGIVELEGVTQYSPSSPYIIYTDSAYLDNTNQCYLDPRSSDIDNYYVGKNIIINNTSYLINKYDGLKRIVTIEGTFETTPSPGDTYEITTTNKWTYEISYEYYPNYENQLTDIYYLFDADNSYLYRFNYPMKIPGNILPAEIFSGVPTFPSFHLGYRIRKQRPLYHDVIQDVLDSTTQIKLPSSASSEDDYYVGKWIWISNTEQNIFRIYSGDDKTIYFQGSRGSGWGTLTPDSPTLTFKDPTQVVEVLVNVDDVYETDYFVGMTIVMLTKAWNNLSSTLGYNSLLLSTFTNQTAAMGGIVLSSSNTNPMSITLYGGFPTYFDPLTNIDFLSVYFIKTNPNGNKYYYITNYDSSTRIITLSTQLAEPVSFGDFFDIDNATIISTPIVGIDRSLGYSIEECMLFNLQSIILPNQTLDVGNRISFYPYVYVEVSNLNIPDKNIIFSNNPFAVNSRIKVPIYNVIDPNISTFVRLDGRGMNTRIYFKFGDTIRIKVLLPNGTVFKTELNDSLIPSEPIPDLQCFFTFELSKI
jgi:hypothetical protein